MNATLLERLACLVVASILELHPIYQGHNDPPLRTIERAKYFARCLHDHHLWEGESHG